MTTNDTFHLPPFDLTSGITLLQLRDRLSSIIAEHEARGRPERNNQHVVLEVPQAATPSGRQRPSAYVPVSGCYSGTVGNNGVLLTALFTA